MLNQNTFQVNFSDDTFATIEGDVLLIHQGQRTGSDSDWGGQVIASLELDKALAIAEAVKAIRTQAVIDDLLAAEDEAIEAWGRRLDEQKEAAYCLVSENF